MKKLTFLAVTLALFCIAASAQVASQPAPPSASPHDPSRASKGDEPTAPVHLDRPEQTITAYTLPPDSYKKSQDLSRIYLRFRLLGFMYLLVVLWLMLRWRIAPRYRDVAERVSSNRFVQALVFAPLFFISLDVFQLPFGIYGNWLFRKYGISIQGWRSWFWDWAKGELITATLAIILLYLLFLIIRKSPRRWWLYFWVASLPVALLLFFVQPLIIDPLFHKFEPLSMKDPALTASLEILVKRSGEDIPRERMFWMGASEKTTDLNAYVTGFGSSKRIVIWDTTIAKMDSPQITFVVAHEMGHYVLNHIPKLLGFEALLLFVSFYVGYLCVRWGVSVWGVGWGLRGVEDYAVAPFLLFILAIFFFLTTPVESTYSRYYEHQADKYGLELTHVMNPESGQIAAQAFQILGEVSYDDPNPSPLRVFLFYDHPAIPDRVQFSLHYDPWSKGAQPEFVK